MLASTAGAALLASVAGAPIGGGVAGTQSTGTGSGGHFASSTTAARIAVATPKPTVNPLANPRRNDRRLAISIWSAGVGGAGGVGGGANGSTGGTPADYARAVPGQDDDRRRTGRHGVVPLAPPSSSSPPVRTPAAAVVTAAPPRRRRRRSPTRVHPRPAGPLLLLAPLFVVTGAVGLGAFHAWLGLPLGGAFAAELWGVAKNLGIMLIPYIPAALGVHRTNRAALAYDRELAAEEAAKRWRPIPPVNRRRDERALARGRTEAHDGGGDEREAGAGEDDVRPADPDEEGDDDDHDHHGRDPRGRTPSAPRR